MIDYEKMSGIISQMAELHKKARAAQEQALQEYNISLGEYRMIAALGGENPPETQAALGAALGIDKALVTRNIAVMEQKGYLTRTQNPRCRREYRVELTETARRIIPALAEVHRKKLKELFSEVEEDELETLQVTLGKIICNL